LRQPPQDALSSPEDGLQSQQPQVTQLLLLSQSFTAGFEGISQGEEGSATLSSSSPATSTNLGLVRLLGGNMGK
jgi:hypothetical protein